MLTDRGSHMLEGFPLAGLADKGLTVSLILLAAWGYHRGWWVGGREFRAVVVDRDFWREIGIKGVSTAEKMADRKDASLAHVEAIAREAEKAGGDP